MSDELTNRALRDRPRINITLDHERRHWARSLGVTEDELKHAVHAAGDCAYEVRNYLNAQDFVKHLKDYMEHRKPYPAPDPGSAPGAAPRPN